MFFKFCWTKWTPSVPAFNKRGGAPPKRFLTPFASWQGPSNGFSTANLGTAPTALSSDELEGQDAKFSTADRTILEQLKLNIRAREDGFVVKGIGNLVMGGGQCRGKKHHSYPAKQVPYPRSYDKEVMDLWVEKKESCFQLALNQRLPDLLSISPNLVWTHCRDVWETMLCFDMCKSLTWHVFETPPTKV